MDLFGAFHLTAGLLTVAAAALLARLVTSQARDMRQVDRILAYTGCVLIILELFKQIYIFFNVSDMRYDFWYFPFQLCSVPMYLCLLLPFAGRKRTDEEDRLHDALTAFLASYTFIGAAAALIYPQDFLRPQLLLTLHGFIWHGLLLFISVTAMWSRLAADDGADVPGAQFRSMLHASLLFSGLCMIAVIINVSCEGYMQTYGRAHSYAAMFYLNPYHISPQPVVSSVQESLGIPAGLVLYALTIALTSALFFFTNYTVYRHIKMSKHS